MSNKYVQVTVISVASGHPFEERGNEIETAGVTCTLTDLRPAPVRIIIRDGATVRDINQALRAARAVLDLPTTGGNNAYSP
jgi:hypothetical protein